MFGYNPYNYAPSYERSAYLSPRQRAAYLAALERQRRARAQSFNPYYGGFYDPADAEDAESEEGCEDVDSAASTGEDVHEYIGASFLTHFAGVEDNVMDVS